MLDFKTTTKDPIFSMDTPSNKVFIKIADYGISRVTMPSGTKGFGGTEGFMAPEIMKYNGEEEYTEKVKRNLEVIELSINWNSCYRWIVSRLECFCTN